MIERILGVIKLDVNTYEEIEHDAKNGLQQAAMIVAVVALISAIGAAVSARFAGEALDSLSQLEGFGDIPIPGLGAAGNPIIAFIQTLVNSFVTWIVWSYVTYFVGTTLFDGDATPDEMLRVLGFARAPAILSFIPCLGFFAVIWSLVCGFIAVRQGLDLDNGKSALSIIISWVAVVIVSIIINLIFGILA
ncbi:MAG: YIP1 family protein [Candidatus Promineifilaceae bacterium]